MKDKFKKHLSEERFKPFTGKVVDLFNVITIGGGSKSSNIYHVEGPDGTKWAVTTGEDEFKKGSTIKVTRKMNPRKYQDGKFPKKKTPSYRG